MVKKSEKFGVFDLIAPIYNLFYAYQQKQFESVVKKQQELVNLSKFSNIIDVGCGTGALCAVLAENGLATTGVDFSQKMISIAKKRTLDPSINFMWANALERLPFKEKSFDISIASYVAHGLKTDERKRMYDEMKRITEHLIIIYDYNENRSILTNIIECLEGGDYFNFIKTAKLEMEKQFDNVHIVNVGPKAAWYLCSPNEKFQ